MDNELLRLIARLKIAAASGGLTIDVVRFVADRPYARALISRFSDGADEDGVLLALQILDRMGLSAALAADNVVALSVAKPPPPVPPAAAPAPDAPKYVRSLRG